MTVTENKGFLLSDNIIHTEMPTTALRRSKVIRHRQLRLTLMLNFPLYFMSFLENGLHSGQNQCSYCSWHYKLEPPPKNQLKMWPLKMI